MAVGVTPRVDAGPRASHSWPARAVTQHLLVISIDGLRPDAIEAHGATTLQRLMREGSHTLEARTILPSRTLPSHVSMLTGVPPETHGISWNDDRIDREGYVREATVFELASQSGYSTAAFVSKSKLRHLQKPGTLDYAAAPRGNGTRTAAEVADAVSDYLKHRRPNLLFVHIAEPDFAGHTVGWMGRVYGWAVRRADAAVARILVEADAAFGPGNYTVIVTSDHGGHGRGHGSDDPRDVLIPWIAWGRGVAQGEVLPAGIRTTDTAATILRLLGVDVPSGWEGTAVEAALRPAHAPATVPAELNEPGSP